MEWIFLSPHLDDAALSCGGLVSRITRQGEAASVWTICAGDPPEGELSAFATAQHRMWKLGRDAAALRRAEDRRACRQLGANPVYFSFPVCIYRRSRRDGPALYASEAAIFGPIHPDEAALVEAVTRAISDRLPGEARLVCPLGVGGHVDHRLVRTAAEGLGKLLWYYADYPYVREEDASWADGKYPPGEASGWEAVLFTLSAGDLASWTSAVTAYASQVPVFWPDAGAMREDLASYSSQVGGARLWRRRA